MTLTTVMVVPADGELLGSYDSALDLIGQTYMTAFTTIAIPAQVAESDALRDWIYESNRRDDLWFLPDLYALEARLAS